MVSGLPSRRNDSAPTIRELISAGERSFSFEFFPPKTPEAEEVLWRSLRELERLRPTFVSITYGAGGSSRDGTVRVTERVAQDTSMTPLGHLTCVSQSRDELRSVIGAYAGSGVRNVLAIRGDPPGGPRQPWVAHPEGMNHAIELVELVRGLGDFCVGVAAFPDKHPEAEDWDCAMIEATVAAARGQRLLAATWFTAAAQGGEKTADIRDVAEALVGLVTVADDPAPALARLDELCVRAGIVLTPRERALLPE